MAAEQQKSIENAVMRHLRASGEPVREAFLYERVRADGVDADGAEFVAVLMRMEVKGHIHVDTARDEVRDPAPFQPRFWRVIG
jgi:hypothetical protein